jgi:hypothetical protein
MRRSHSVAGTRDEQWYAPFSSLCIPIINPAQNAYVGAVRVIGSRYLRLENLLEQVMGRAWGTERIERAMAGIEEEMVRSESALSDLA